MSSYPWICPACRKRVAAGDAACGNCGCAEDASVEEVELCRLRIAAEANPAEERVQFVCAKCASTTWHRGQLRGSGGGISAAFEFDNVGFDYISCGACGYTEFYRADISGLGRIADLFIG